MTATSVTVNHFLDCLVYCCNTDQSDCWKLTNDKMEVNMLRYPWFVWQSLWIVKFHHKIEFRHLFTIVWQTLTAPLHFYLRNGEILKVARASLRDAIFVVWTNPRLEYNFYLRNSCSLTPPRKKDATAFCLQPMFQNTLGECPYL